MIRHNLVESHNVFGEENQERMDWVEICPMHLTTALLGTQPRWCTLRVVWPLFSQWRNRSPWPWPKYWNNKALISRCWVRMSGVVDSLCLEQA